MTGGGRIMNGTFHYGHVDEVLNVIFLVKDVGRLKMELFADVVPKTAENMR